MGVQLKQEIDDTVPELITKEWTLKDITDHPVPAETTHMGALLPSGITLPEERIVEDSEQKDVLPEGKSNLYESETIFLEPVLLPAVENEYSTRSDFTTEVPMLPARENEYILLAAIENEDVLLPAVENDISPIPC